MKFSDSNYIILFLPQRPYESLFFIVGKEFKVILKKTNKVTISSELGAC